MTCPPHSWLADTPNGPKTRMVCKKCPAVKFTRSYATEEEENKIVLYRRRAELQEVEV